MNRDRAAKAASTHYGKRMDEMNARTDQAGTLDTGIIQAYRRKPRDDIRFRKTVALGTYPEGCKILDVGALDNQLQSFLPSHVSYQAIDHNTCDLNREGLPFEDNAFDYVFLLEVMEHLHRPVEALGECARVAERVILSVPNPAYFQDLIRHALSVDIEPDVGHVNSFLYPNIALICRKLGLRITKRSATSLMMLPVPFKFLSRHQVYLLERA